MNTGNLNGFWVALLIFNTWIGWSQTTKPLDSMTTAEVLDSLLVDRNKANYSFRLFANFKSQRFQFKGDSFSREYTPNNRGGIGFGIASNKLLIDIAFNIKNKDKEPTDRFDMRVSYKWQKHFIDFFFQYYKGFNVSGSQDVESAFRSDIISIASGINYLYLFNEDNFQVGTLRSVISEGDRTDFSYGVGGFVLALDQEGDNLLNVPSVDSNNDKENLFGFGAGVLFGIGGFFSMGSNLYSSVSLNAGAGLMYKDVSDSFDYEESSNPLVYQVNSIAVLGYVREKFYLNLSFELGYYQTEILTGLNEEVWITQAKLAFGYKPFK